MTVLVRYAPTSLSRETYDRVNQALMRRGAEPPAELALHVLFGEDPQLRVSEIWDSEETWRQFRDGVLADAFAEVGLEMPEPQLFAAQELGGSAVRQPA